eukprot:6214829-Pleurochrysis_carterae.AAC.1
MGGSGSCAERDHETGRFDQETVGESKGAENRSPRRAERAHRNAQRGSACRKSSGDGNTQQ